MAIRRSFELDKEAAVAAFKEILSTPMMTRIDLHFHASTEEPMEFKYSITRHSSPITGIEETTVIVDD